jgi:hypothetical protein
VIIRSFWKRLLEDALASAPIVWLAGVRRAGKTVHCQSLPNIDYFDCELPGARKKMEDPERFLGGLAGRRIVIDEIHRLPNPSELLKIAADHFPGVRIVATGSSSLGASRKFKDTLTGRKKDLWLTPMNLRDLSDFGGAELDVRMLRGGLPPFSRMHRHRSDPTRTGSMPSGQRTSSSSSGWSAGRHSCDSPSCSSRRAEVCSRQRASPSPAK